MCPKGLGLNGFLGLQASRILFMSDWQTWTPVSKLSHCIPDPRSLGKVACIVSSDFMGESNVAKLAHGNPENIVEAGVKHCRIW